MSHAQTCVTVPDDGNVSTFMSLLLDDLASVHGQGSEEAKVNASAQAAHDGLDLLHENTLD